MTSKLNLHWRSSTTRWAGSFLSLAVVDAKCSSMCLGVSGSAKLSPHLHYAAARRNFELRRIIGSAYWNGIKLISMMILMIIRAANIHEAANKFQSKWNGWWLSQCWKDITWCSMTSQRSQGILCQLESNKVMRVIMRNDIPSILGRLINNAFNWLQHRAEDIIHCKQ